MAISAGARYGLHCPFIFFCFLSGPTVLDLQCMAFLYVKSQPLYFVEDHPYPTRRQVRLRRDIFNPRGHSPRHCAYACPPPRFLRMSNNIDTGVPQHVPLRQVQRHTLVHRAYTGSALRGSRAALAQRRATCRRDAEVLAPSAEPPLVYLGASGSSARLHRAVAEQSKV